MTEPSEQGEEIRSIYIDGPAGKLHIRDFGGRGPIILAMHGVTGCTYLWDGVAEKITRDFHLVAFDYRGHGQSDWTEFNDYTTETYAHDLEAAIAWVSSKTTQPLILMGSSWGALAMLKRMEEGADDIQSLIIVDVEPSFDASEYAVPPRPYKFRSFETLLEWERKANPSAPEYALKAFAQGSVVRTEDGEWIRRHDPFFLTRWPFRNSDLWSVLPHINIPVLILNGDRSFVKESVCREMASRLTQSAYVKVPDAGHLIPLEQPELVSGRIIEFLR